MFECVPRQLERIGRTNTSPDDGQGVLS